MVDLILFPSSFFSRENVDEDLQKEYDSVIVTGLFDVAIFGYSQWFDEGELLLNKKFAKEQIAIYRGWMMSPEQYSNFYNLLLKKNIRLLNNPNNYRLFHLFPNIYEILKEDTAKMEIYPLHQQIDIEKLKKNFQKFMVKDYVKSVKGTDFPKFFDHNVEQKEFDRCMEIFYNYRGDLLTGGICIKEFLDLKYYGKNTNEYRVFYMNNKVATVTRNSNQENNTPQPPKYLIEKYKNLDSPFYTIDYAELKDGSWKIIEAGDGGVSGLPDTQDYDLFFRKLFQFFE